MILQLSSFIVPIVETSTPLSLLLTGFASVVSGLVVAVVWMYKDTKKDRKFYWDELKVISEKSNLVTEKQVQSNNNLNSSVDKLSNVLNEFRTDFKETKQELHSLTTAVERLDARLK